MGTRAAGERAGAVTEAEAEAMVGEATAVAAAATGTAAAATGTVAYWAADRTTAAPPPGTCSGRSAGRGGGEAARVMRATMLPRMVRQE